MTLRDRLTLNSAREVPDDLLRRLRVRWPAIEVVYYGSGAGHDVWLTGFRRPNEYRRLAAGRKLDALTRIAKVAHTTMQYKATPTQRAMITQRLADRWRWWTLLREGFVAVHTHGITGEPDGRLERALEESDWVFYHEGDQRFEQVMDAATDADENPAAMAARVREQLKAMDMWGYWRKRTHLVGAA